MKDNSNGIVILITLLNILVNKLQKLQEAQQTRLQEAEKTICLPFSIPKLCRRFPLTVIQSATNNFSEELVIGKGGFGNIYKGVIDFGETKVAIKRRKLDSKQGIKEFYSEIQMLTKLQHCHIVSLVGYCDDNEEMILVYEYIPRGTLADHLYKKVRKDGTSLSSLSWVQRLKICIGAAHGLDYLHTGTGIENRVIHRDVKASNILLDDNFAAKVSDFGLSKTGPANQTCTYVNTGVKGTRGYVDPYSHMTRRLTKKSDVYSFGVLLFEVLCGRQALDRSLDKDQINLADWAQQCSRDGLLGQITDPGIKCDISSESLNVYVEVAIKCLNTTPKRRPSMAEIVVSLESALAFQEKSAEYTLVEIMPDDCMEDVGCVIPEEKDINREYEYTGKETIGFSNGRHHKKHTSATRTFMKREYSGKGSIKFFSGWPFSVTRDTKTLRNGTGLTVLSSTPLNQEEIRNQEVIMQSSKLKSFTFNDLSVATRRFHSDNVIGKGGFGTVFKGWVDKNTLAAKFSPGSGLVIAVKRLDGGSKQGRREWFKYNAKISDFGLAKDGPEHEETHVSTTVKGTLGYLDPDYFHKGYLRMKSDIYGFGVVLLEVLTGRRAFDNHTDPPLEDRHLVSWAKSRVSKDHMILDIMDADIKGQYTLRAAFKAFSLALECTSDDSELRPDAEQVVKKLEQLHDLVNDDRVY